MNPARSAGIGGVAPAPRPDGSNVLLYGQFDGPSGNGVPDQDFEASFNAFDAWAADDFVVPAGTTWLVDEVRTVGTTGTPGGATVSVTFYANSPGGGDPDLPGAAVPGCSYTGLVPTDVAGSFTIVLPTVCSLAAGAYWVGIQTAQNVASFGQHFWSNRTVQTGSEAVWRNPGDGFATGCLDWEPQTECGVGGGAAPDLLFQIFGNVGGADLALALTDTPDPVVAGASMTYTATLTNHGPSAASDAALSLPMAAGTGFVSAVATGATCTTPAVGANGTLACTWTGVTGIGAGNARTATITVSVPASAAAGTVFSVTGTVSSPTSDSTPGNNQATTTTTVATSADLSMTLIDNQDPVTAGAALTYTATAINSGPSDAQDVAISLPVPVNTTLVSASGGTCVATTCTFSGATAPNAIRVATYVFTVLPSATNGSTISALASVNSTTNDANPANNSAPATTAVTASADLAAGLTLSPIPATAGTNLIYTATVANLGPSDAQNAQISLPLPAGTSLVSASGLGASCSGTNSVVCVFAGATAANIARTATVTVLVAPGVANGAALSATHTVSSATPDPVNSNNAVSATVEVTASADLALTLNASSVDTPPNVPVTFTAVSANLGPSDAQNLSISTVLSPDFRFGTVTPGAGGACTAPQAGLPGTVTCTYAGATASNASRTMLVTAAAMVDGVTTINASTTSATSDPVTANNAASVSMRAGFPFEAIPVNNRLALVLMAVLLGGLGLAVVRRNG